MATTFESELGAVAWLKPLSPQPVILPSVLTARQLLLPQARATALVNPLGTFVWPKLLSPQATTELAWAWTAPKNRTQASRWVGQISLSFRGLNRCRGTV